jgi:hypothetical protein
MLTVHHLREFLLCLLAALEYGLFVQDTSAPRHSIREFELGRPTFGGLNTLVGHLVPDIAFFANTSLVAS